MQVEQNIKMAIEINQSFLKKYLQDKKRHEEFKETVKMYEEIKVHADGNTPDKILLQRRPGESKYIFDYRTAIYQPKTKRVVSKIINTLSMINRSVDWAITYDVKAQPTRLGENTLQQYCEVDYPMFGSLTNWAFAIGLKQYLIDPNAVCLVRYNKPLSPNEYPEPILEIFNSDDVYDYKEGQYCVLESEEKSTYIHDGRTYEDGEVYWIVTDLSYYKVMQNGPKNTDWIIEETQHTAGSLPAFRLGGLIKESDQEFLYESRIGGIVPSLNTAVSLYSDKQAEIVQHVHSLMWQFETQKCTKCNGTTFYKPNAEAAPITCPDCKGHGTVPTSPYESMVLNSNTVGVGQSLKDLPMPLAGYIQKSDVALMLKAMSEEIKQEIFDAYSAVNMEHLADVPLAQSGTAKAMDGDSLNNFVYAVASDMVSILNKAYWYIAMLRYGYQINDKKVIYSMVPKINVPQKFDLLSSNNMVAEISTLREAKVDPFIIMAVERNLVAKKFKDDNDVQQLIKTSFALNPLPGITEEEKTVRLQNGGVDVIDYIISCNLIPFIRKASQESPSFYELEPKKQYEVLVKFAQKKRNEISGVTDIKDALNVDPQAGNTLANSVGGLTGMIEIVKAVASGVYDLDAAVSLVAQRFGISEEEARRQLGTPQVIQSQTDASLVQKLT